MCKDAPTTPPFRAKDNPEKPEPVKLHPGSQVILFHLEAVSDLLCGAHNLLQDIKTSIVKKLSNDNTRALASAILDKTSMGSAAGSGEGEGGEKGREYWQTREAKAKAELAELELETRREDLVGIEIDPVLNLPPEAPGTEKKKVVYIAGPYRGDTLYEIVRNIRRAEAVAFKYWHMGFAVICPHMNTALLDGACPDEGDLELLRCCDIIVMMKGYSDSTGALAELKEAKKRGMEIIFEDEKDSET